MISPLAVVETDRIGDSVTIQEYAIIRKNVVLGDGVVIHPYVVVEEGVEIGPGTEVYPGSYLGKTPKGAGALSRPLSWQPRVCLGHDCTVGPNAVVFYDVEIGDHTLVGDGASIREGSRIGSRCVVGRYVTVNYDTIIGDDVKIMDHCWLAGNMTIGSNVFISGGVLTANDNAMGIDGYHEEMIAGPHIEDGARVGAGAILLPGVAIGENAVVAAGATVTKAVEASSIVMGVPARAVGSVPTQNGRERVAAPQSLRDCSVIDLPKITDPRGNLTFIEGEKHVPFGIKRVFFLYDVPGGAWRAGHALKNCHQFIIAASGSFEVVLDDGSQRRRYHMNRSYYGLYIPPLIWREIDDFSSGSVCMVLASEYYDEADYFRDYAGFLAAVQERTS